MAPEGRERCRFYHAQDGHANSPASLTPKEVTTHCDAHGYGWIRLLNQFGTALAQVIEFHFGRIGFKILLLASQVRLNRESSVETPGRSGNRCHVVSSE